MAKTVQPIAIELGIKGGEKLAALNRSFRDLSKQVKLSDADIIQATKDVIAFAEGAGRSVATIKAQAKALQGLQDQARIGGKIYKQLGDDIRLLKTEIDSLEGAAKSTGQAFRAMSLPSKVPEKFAENMRARRQELQGLAADSREYLNALTGITNFERQQSVREQRAGVSAAARAAQAGLPRAVADTYLPDTLAGLKQRANELDFEIQNLTIGSDEYIRANRELVDVQEQLNFVVNGSTRAFEELDRAQSGAERRAKKLADIQSYYGEKAGAGVSGYRDPKTGAIIAPPASGSARVSLVQQPVREISGLYQSIGDVGMQKISADIEMMGNSYQEVAQDIRNATKASNNSIASLNSQRNSWARLRDQLDPTSKNFREVTREIERVDKALEKTSRRRRMSAGQLAQAAGATISGGIFGGPEGFLGGAIGTAFGGAGGAFAGAAIGAQVGGLRREIGGYAEYAAQIEKLKIALEGISGPQEEYNRALEAANSVTNDLNVPQEVAIQGITRLTAAVKGAGGGVADAELAFKNINSAIIATGGGAEQVEGAVTALVQIFSKGKVSAEEINQIAERLPGTFNKIAEASGRTGPQLTKALQDGEVGLNDLMKFLVELGDEYGLLAQKIANSSESAGARLQVAYDKMRQEVGKALQPIGAEFQDAFAEFLTDITPALVDAAKAVGDGMKFIFDNREAIGTAASLAAKIVAVNFAFKAFAALNGPVKAMFLMLQAEMSKTTAQAIVARSKLMGVFGAVKALSLVGIVTVTIDVVVTGLRDLARARKSIEKLRGKVLKPGSVAAEFGGSIPAETKAEAEKILKQVKAEIQSIEDRAGLAKAVTGGRETIFSKVEDARLEELNLRRLELLQKIALPIRQKSEPKITVFDEPDLGEGGDGGTSKQKQQRKSQLESIRNGEKLLDIELMLLDNSREIGKAQFENNFARVNELNNQKISLEFAKQAAQNEFEYRDAVAQAIDDENQAAIIQEAALKREIQDRLLLIQYEGALSDEAQRRALEQKAAAKASQDELFSLREKLGLVSDQERISKYRTNLEEQGTPNADELTDLYRQTIDPTFAEGISQNIRALKEDLKELVDPINQVTGAAKTIGTAFTDSFMSAITGSATAQDALANFFSNTAKYFLDMAAQIIQKMITMAILNQVVGLLPGGGGGGFQFSGGSADAGLNAANLMGGITPFAMGGIVDKPTMFAYANGGVGRFGIMGEAGPEAILPLQRGPGGKLGVQASGGSVGDVVVNVDATGSSVEGNGQQAGQLGRAIGAAVQAELVKQKRPGGLLAS